MLTTTARAHRRITRTGREEHTQVYLGVSRFSWSFTLLENMSRFLGGVGAGKSHYRSFKFTHTELVRSLLHWNRNILPPLGVRAPYDLCVIAEGQSQRGTGGRAAPYWLKNTDGPAPKQTGFKGTVPPLSRGVISIDFDRSSHNVKKLEKKEKRKSSHQIKSNQQINIKLLKSIVSVFFVKQNSIS